MQLKDIVGLSAMALVFGWLFMAIWFGNTAQRRKIVSLSLDLNDRKSATYVVEETIPYDIIEWSLEKKQKTPRGKFERIMGYTKYEPVRGPSARSAGEIIVAVGGKLILKNSIDFSVTPEGGGRFYADDLVQPRGVKRGCLRPGNIVSVEVSCIETPFTIEVYFCTSIKAKFLGHKQSS